MPTPRRSVSQIQESGFHQWRSGRIHAKTVFASFVLTARFFQLHNFGTLLRIQSVERMNEEKRKGQAIRPLPQ